MMDVKVQLLTERDGQPVTAINRDGKSPLLLVCEHASLKMPERLGTLGLDQAALHAHIAWDPGALAVARLLSEQFDAALVHQNFSRLAYDCNRPPEAVDCMPSQSEIYAVPGNRGIDPAERQARVEEIYLPFRNALATAIAERSTIGRPTILVTIHSFTPIYKGTRREVEIGILHDADSRLADGMLAAAEGGPFVVRRNEPYGPVDGVTHTLKEHGLANGLPNVMIEVRNDLIGDDAGQRVVAGYLAALLNSGVAALAGK